MSDRTDPPTDECEVCGRVADDVATHVTRFRGEMMICSDVAACAAHYEPKTRRLRARR